MSQKLVFDELKKKDERDLSFEEVIKISEEIKNIKNQEKKDHMFQNKYVFE